MKRIPHKSKGDFKANDFSVSGYNQRQSHETQ